MKISMQRGNNGKTRQTCISFFIHIVMNVKFFSDRSHTPSYPYPGKTYWKKITKLVTFYFWIPKHHLMLWRKKTGFHIFCIHLECYVSEDRH
jgi:hypothetical protein